MLRRQGAAPACDGWGAFDPDSGEHRSPDNERGQEHVPPVCVVTSEVYKTLSEADIVENDVVCEGLEWVQYEVAREKLRLEMPPDLFSKLSPLEVVMNA